MNGNGIIEDVQDEIRGLAPVETDQDLELLLRGLEEECDQARLMFEHVTIEELDEDEQNAVGVVSVALAAQLLHAAAAIKQRRAEKGEKAGTLTQAG